MWVPELKTDTSGFASLDVPMADSITTWRVTALASTQDGKLGFSNAALRVFQDFFVDIDLPVALTQNDEVAIPIAVYNYLPDPQNVRLEVKQDAWFELQDQPEKTLQIAANDIDVVYFRIKVKQFGEQAFQVTAWGDKMSDAIKRSVAVVPDGRLFRKSKSDWLRQGTSITTTDPASNPSPGPSASRSRSIPAWSARSWRDWKRFCDCRMADLNKVRRRRTRMFLSWAISIRPRPPRRKRR